VLREKLENIYNREKIETKDKEEMSELQKEGVDLWVELIKMREIREKGSQATPELQKSKKSPNLSARVCQSVESLESKSTADERSVKDLTLEKEQTEERSLVCLEFTEVLDLIDIAYSSL
jgi:SET domain-containing protein